MPTGTTVCRILVAMIERSLSTIQFQGKKKPAPGNRFQAPALIITTYNQRLFSTIG
jgi:hypothetical protein